MNEFPTHLIGRDYLINEICDSVRGNRVSIVGPPKNGKTIILNHLCSTDSLGIKSDIIYWDIEGKTPQDDTELLEQFASDSLTILISLPMSIIRLLISIQKNGQKIYRNF